MDESTGAQYALHIAVHTLRDRCKNLQQRVSSLEEENIQLRVKCVQHAEQLDSLSELDKMKTQITELSEHNGQLQDKIKMVTIENQNIWYKLGKLINVNKNLGDQLNKINETVKQHSSPQTHTTLIRSKTFTQDEPHTKFLQKNLELNEKISLELENVSLKLTDSFSKQKMELEKICSEIDGVDNGEDISGNCGFVFEDESDNELVEEFKYVIEDITMLREEVLEQKRVLEWNVKNLERLSNEGGKTCKVCDNKKQTLVDKGTLTIQVFPHMSDAGTDLPNFGEDIVQSKKQESLALEKLCPMCTKIFGKEVDFSIFQQHVEDHFDPDISSYGLI